MPTLPTRRARTPKPQSRQHKAAPSQTTIDSYFGSIRRGENDIRNYFPPVAKTKAGVISPKQSREDEGAAKRQDSGPSTGLLSSSSSSSSSSPDSTAYIAESRRSGEKAGGTFVKAPAHHSHAESGALPRSDPLFDSARSTPPLAPRVSDGVRHSLVPKPLSFKSPPPPPLTAEASRSPSPTTSSPSSVGDADTSSLDGEERREAPSFKQTYLSVHSRQNTNDGPLSPLTALRDPGPMPLRQRGDFPTTLRSRAAPKLADSCAGDSVIYFLPKISPSSDSSADEREPVMRTSYAKRMKKASIRSLYKAKRPLAEMKSSSPSKIDHMRKDAPNDGTVAISPGLQKYYEYLASQKHAASDRDKGKEREKVDGNKEEKPLAGHPDWPSASKKKKKGTGLLRLMEAYSKHVEGLQMIQ